MPVNLPGILVPFQLVFNPRLALPALTINDIRQLDFYALKKAGYRGAVFDKDNCLTLPNQDSVVPELRDTWMECKNAFGPENILIVSNSAGTLHDAGDIQAESVSYHLGVRVLRHNAMKPAYSCIKSIRSYFSTLVSPIREEELVVVGDRIFTDIVMANRMAASKRIQSGEEKEKGMNRKLEGPLAIWTTGVWKRESMMMRWVERRMVSVIQRWTGSERDRFRKFLKR